MSRCFARTTTPKNSGGRSTDVSEDRIFRLGEADNFWQMGETGPCGPCSEIYYDFGPEAGPGAFPENPGDRFVEIWNLVFMQYDRDSSGKMTPLPRPSIDTGMGLERTAAVLQGKLSNYDTDLLLPIIGRAGELFKKTYGDDDRTDTALRINADHARSTAFLINDGVLPSNEGPRVRAPQDHAPRDAQRAHGRRLRSVPVPAHRIRRRAHARCLSGNDGKCLSCRARRQRRRASLRDHLPGGREILPGRGQRGALTGAITGAASFKLYDTYGLALEEQEDMARELGISIDAQGFAAEMEKQRARARASWKGAEKAQINPVYQALPKTEFLGRETLEAPAKVTAVLHGEIALDRTPFYAEAGGQVGDKGVLVSENGQTLAIVESAYAPAPGKTVHKVKLLNEVKEGDIVIARVDPGIAPRHHAQPHWYASSACRVAHRARHSRETSR